MQNRISLVLMVGILTFCYLIAMGLTWGTRNLYSVEDVLQPGFNSSKEPIILKGKVGEKIVRGNYEYEFQLLSEQGLGSVAVKARGPKPDTLLPGVVAVLEGTWEESGVFRAKEVKTQCATKYSRKE